MEKWWRYLKYWWLELLLAVFGELFNNLFASLKPGSRTPKAAQATA
ncbi:hypothetical protein QP938_08750 [Porticoccaceae bacterium LTM1]|nr:hypothetical protein QP938_08750 [Porticoccaceae bacterium LTM1]